MKEIGVRTTKRVEAVDITDNVRETVRDAEKGVLFVFVPHCTAALAVNELEPGLAGDYEKLFSMLREGKWRHDEVDDNAAAHLAAVVAGGEKFFLVEKGKIVLGAWQRIILMEFDGPRERKVLCKMVPC